MKISHPRFVFVAMLFVLLASTIFAQQDTGVRAQAQDTVNMRTQPGTDAELIGQMTLGISYPVLGRSELFPWLLIGDPVTFQPLGWVYQEIVALNASPATLPVSSVIIQPGSQAPIATATQSGSDPQTAPLPTATIQTSPTPTFTVAGTVQDEVNIRYGPAVTYPRVGIAQAGDRFQITGWHTQFPWVQIRYDPSPTGYAWIAIDLLVITGDIYTLPPISATTFNLPTLTPTPSVIQSSSVVFGETVALSPEFSLLGDRMWQQMLALGFDPQTSRFGSVFLGNMQTGEAITFGGNIAYRGTSVNKISILAALYSVLEVPPTQTLATDIANTMICSENSATNRLLAEIGEGDEWVGAQRVTDFLKQIGIENTFLLAPFTVDPTKPPIPPYPIPVPVTGADQLRANPEPYNQLTVEDMGWLLTSIYQCAYEERGPLIERFPPGTYDPRECRQMVHVMASNNVDGLLKAGVPAGIRVAHKHGWVNDTHSNAGIFFTPGGSYVLAMSLHSTQIDATGERYLAFPQTLPALAETSRMVYNYFNPEAILPGIRDGFIPDAPTCNFAGTPLITDLMQSVWDQ